jgi:L-aspartate oxidase
LVDGNGKRFMQDYHPDLELAPRDVVSRSIIDFISKNKTRYVFLDARHIKNFAQRFPYITELCKTFDIDVTKALIPVRPSAHYMIGGAKTDLNAKTNIENLYACGEVSSSGLHGANRLASNSLLEGLVFGQIAGENAGNYIKNNPTPMLPVEIKSPKITTTDTKNLDISDLRQSLRSTMWRLVAIQRHKTRLDKAMESIEFWGSYVLNKSFTDPFGWETQNMLTIAWLTTEAALKRTESRGVHYREDYPTLDEKNWQTHITQRINEP